MLNISPVIICWKGISLFSDKSHLEKNS